MTKARSNATAPAAKGQIVVGTGTDTSGILSAGSNGETLVADSSATVGLRYTATPSASNPILNSSFDVWQRGTSFANPTSNAYVADRFQQSVPTNTTISRQATGDTTNLPSIQYNIRVQRNNAAATTGTFYLGQASEIENCVPFAGKTITFSFYARKGANYSSASDALTLRFFTGNTGTQQNGFTGTYTGSVSVINEVFTLTTTWQRFTKTVTLNSDITQFSYWFQHTTVGTAGAADYYDLTGVQIDVGSVALPFRRSSATIAGELAACQRYYQLGAGFMAIADGATLIKTGWSFKTTMRTSPSVSASAAFQVFYPGVDYTQSSANIAIESSRVSAEGAQLKMDNFTGLTAGRIYTHNVGNGNILLSAEL